MITGNFILLDAARMNEAMDEAKKLNPLHESLYNMEEELLQSVAPYLFEFDNQGDFNNYFLEKGWGDSWGVLFFSRADFGQVHRHLRRFLTVKTEDGLELYFRFYDPRVLRIFLPTCDINQLLEFFGPIQFFMIEDEDSRYGVKFWLENGELQSKKIHFREIFTDANNMDTPPAEKIIQHERETDNPLFIPKRQYPEKNISNPAPELPKPTKPKWNMFD